MDRTTTLKSRHADNVFCSLVAATATETRSSDGVHNIRNPFKWAKQYVRLISYRFRKSFAAPSQKLNSRSTAYRYSLTSGCDHPPRLLTPLVMFITFSSWFLGTFTYLALCPTYVRWATPRFIILHITFLMMIFLISAYASHLEHTIVLKKWIQNCQGSPYMCPVAGV